MKWGDDDGEGDDDEKLQQPSKVSSFSSAPDKDGIKTVTEFRTEEDGSKVKVIRKVKETRVKVRENKNVLQRRKDWPKFGDCVGLPPGPEANITYPTHENINLQLKPRKREDDAAEDDDPFKSLKAKSGAEGNSIVVCRHCGETGHWTLKCPKRGEIVVKTKSRPNESGSTAGEGGPTGGDARMAERAGAEPGKYVPMHLRAGAASKQQDQRREDDGCTLRVTNISEDTNEDDLRELFRRFGHTTRIYLAKDRQTQQSRGFAFISYGERRDCQKAVDGLNGHGYDNLILHVEFAKPREEGPEKPSVGAQGAGKAGWTMQGTR